MKRIGEIVVAALLLTAGCMTCPHPDSDGWGDVFNKDLSNATCAKPGWAWDKDGYLVPGTGETLFSKKDYKNFVLDLAYVMDPTANSGVFLYDTDHPKYKFEVQILDDHHPCYSNEVPYQLTGAIYGRCAPKKVASRPAGELNRMTCWCEGSRVRIVVNGELATKERTLTLDALDGIAAYTVEPLYASGTTLIVR